jgi:hypothetical protein
MIVAAAVYLPRTSSVKKAAQPPAGSEPAALAAM